jgi:hypothetical protein
MLRARRIPRPFLGRRALPFALAAFTLASAAARAATPPPLPGGRGPASPVTVVAVGDIACSPDDPLYDGGLGTAEACQQKATSDLALALQPGAALLLGDLQYDVGALVAFQQSFAPTWGRLLAISHSAVGNHEYGTPGAGGYRAYFGSLATPQGTTWYAFDLAGWHLVALDANCTQVGGCGEGSPELAWLRADLAVNPGRCTLAYWHQPRFSSGPHGSDAAYAPFWSTLHAAGADLVLAGHDHDYERFAPQDPAGGLDRVGGIRELVVGTGGRSLYDFATQEPHSEARRRAFGVLALTLYPLGYTFAFLPVDGSPGDSGGGLCHAAWPGPMPDYHAVPRCRAVDTGSTPNGGVRGERDLPIAGLCGVPPSAVAVTAEVTVLSAGGSGRLALYPAGGAPTTATSFALRGRAPQRAQVLQPLGVHGMLTANARLHGDGAVQLLLEVTGYFE